MQAQQAVTLHDGAGQRASFTPSKNSWSFTDGVSRYHHQVEDAYDRDEPEPLLPLDYPEGRRGREMAAKALTLVTELLRVLEAKGALDADEVRQLTAAAERQVEGLSRELSRMDDIDTDH